MHAGARKTWTRSFYWIHRRSSLQAGVGVADSSTVCPLTTVDRASRLARQRIDRVYSRHTQKQLHIHDVSKQTNQLFIRALNSLTIISQNIAKRSQESRSCANRPYTLSPNGNAFNANWHNYRKNATT